MENSLLGGIVRKIIIINELNHDYYYPLLEKKAMTIIIRIMMLVPLSLFAIRIQIIFSMQIT
jgi:hypothetical protein